MIFPLNDIWGHRRDGALGRVHKRILEDKTVSPELLRGRRGEEGVVPFI